MRDDVQFYEIGLKLVKSSENLNRALGEIVHLAAEAGNSYAASLFLVDWSQKVLKPAVTFGLPSAYVEGCGNVVVGEQCCGRAVESRGPWVVSDMLHDPLFAAGKGAALRSPIRAAFSVPVLDHEKKCIGSLACHFAEVHTPSPEEIDRNQTWAEMIAHIIAQNCKTETAPANSRLVTGKNPDGAGAQL